MLLKSLELLNLIQVIFQVGFWYRWLARFNEAERVAILIIESLVLLVLVAVPVAFLITGVVQVFQHSSSTLWLGRGCCVAALEVIIAKIFVTIFCRVQVFRADRSVEVKQRGLSIILSILSFLLALLAILLALLAIVAAERQRLAAALSLAGLGISCIQLVCAWWAGGREGKIRRAFTSIILLAEVFTLLGQLLTALGRNGLVMGSDRASTAIWVLSQCGLWLQGIMSFDPVLDLLDSISAPLHGHKSEKNDSERSLTDLQNTLAVSNPAYATSHPAPEDIRPSTTTASSFYAARSGSTSSVALPDPDLEAATYGDRGDMATSPAPVKLYGWNPRAPTHALNSSHKASVTRDYGGPRFHLPSTAHFAERGGPRLSTNSFLA